MKKLIFVTCLLLVLSIFWMSRYTIIPTSREWVYKVDRISGKITVLIFDKEQEITQLSH